MSAVADKARYYLEQSVPELKEYERKKIFSADEITSIAKKRSDFEHKVNARGSSPSDYAQYAEFEMNVDSLRRKRVKRLGVRSTTHNGQRRVYFVLDRGTRKFPGDIDLWMQTIEYARKQKAYKKLTQIFTNVLRLHPAKSDLWIYAAQFAIEENADMTEARSYMQRGLRFCKSNTSIWLEYARLEMSFMAKIHARRQILGLGVGTNNNNREEGEEDNEDVMKFPKLTAEDVNPSLDVSHNTDQDALHNLDSTPIMSGAIPQTIFDAAMAQFNYNGLLGQNFFDMFTRFGQVPATPKLIDHVVKTLMSHCADNWHSGACFIAQPLVGISDDQPKFPAALRETIKRAREVISGGTHAHEVQGWYVNWLRQKETPDMEPALKQVISAQLAALDSNRVQT